MGERGRVFEANGPRNDRRSGKRHRFLLRLTALTLRQLPLGLHENYRDLLTRLSTALAMTEAAYLEARRRRDL
jgi:hypothetical protein